MHEPDWRRLQDEQGGAEDLDAAQKEQQPIEFLAIRSGSAIHMSAYQQHRAETDHRFARRQNRMRQADNLYVESVSVMPPVVEGRRGEHRNSAPGGNKATQRAAKTPHRNRSRSGFARGTKGSREDCVPARDSGKDAGQVNGHVRRSPKSVAADRNMPGDIPVTAERVGDHRSGKAPYIPRDRGRARGVERPIDQPFTAAKSHLLKSRVSHPRYFPANSSLIATETPYNPRRLSPNHRRDI